MTTINTDQLYSTPDPLLCLSDVLALIGVSESTWWAGVKSGKYPVGLKHGRCRFWTVEEIHELIERIAKRVGAES